MAKDKQQMPTMEDIMSYLTEQSRPVMKKELTRALKVQGDGRTHVKKMIREMREKGLIHTEQKGHRIVLTDTLPKRAIIEITGIDSMGDLVARPFEWLSETPAPQIIITKDNLSPPAGIGDVVQAEVSSMGNRIYHAKTIRRVSAGENQMVGVYEDGKVYSVDKRLRQSFTLTGMPAKNMIHNRDLILVEIPMIRVRNPNARFIKRLGTADEPYAPTLVSIYTHHLKTTFPEHVEKQADKAVVPKVGKQREDLRSVPFVTIDGADARDFDDAVWAEPDSDKNNAGGWHLMIGIADVAYYVRPETALDMEARGRGNSVYFPDRVLPMLPVGLSNGVCSLKPNEPRAAMVCEVWINRNGHKLKHQFRRALIQSVRRLTYDEVQAHMDGMTPIVGLEQEIKHLTGAYEALKKARQKRGVLEIDVPEKQVVLNKKGKVVAIRQREQTPSMQLIEEMMILANVSAAETLEEKGAPTMYRVHDRPSAEKTENLKTFLKAVGISDTVPDNPEPHDFNTVLMRSDGQANDRTVNELVLRAQSQAVYSPENIGHFGLALMRYAHFTSPIRRYADILVHRALIKALKLGAGELSSEEANTFEDLAHHISATERQAASAEMDALDRYVARFLADKVGEAFDTRISSVTPFGLFLSIEPYGADGFVPFKNLVGDYYDFDDKTQTLTGRATGHTYRIGDCVRAVLKECVPITGGLLFSIVGSKKQVPQQKKKQSRKLKKHKI